MRPFEHHSKQGFDYINQLVESKSQSIGLLCSFRENVRLKRSIYRSKYKYNFSDLKNCFGYLCNEKKWNLNIVGQNLTSKAWMEEVMRVIFTSHWLVIDITDIRPNVLYELGIACSLRPENNVIIIKNKVVKIDSSEILQLQILPYKNIEDLKEQLRSIFKNNEDPITMELAKIFPSLHNKLSYYSMKLLSSMKRWYLHRKEAEKEDIPGWHIGRGDLDDLNTIQFAKELNSLGLSKFEYGYSDEENVFEWALHPTEFGKRYIKSQFFLKYFHPESEIESIQNRLNA